MVRTRPSNEVLARCLAELRWSPRTLARRINAAYGPGTISESAPYHWRDRGRVPYPPVAEYAARVIAEALGRPIATDALWTRASDSPEAASRGLLDILDRAASDGERLPDVAREYLCREPGPLSRAREHGSGVELVRSAERGVDALREAAAGAEGLDALGYVAAQFQATRLLLGQGGRSDGLNRRLLLVLAELAQLAAWLAVDADRHRESRRYLVTGLRAAHEGGSRRLLAHLLRDLSANMALQGRHADAVAIGEAALAAAAGTRATGAFAAGQLAYAQALAGDTRSACRTADQAAGWIAATPGGDEPEWVRRVAADTAGPMAARTLLQLARDERARGRRASARTLVRRGISLLRPPTLLEPDHPHPRAALYEGIYLAGGHVISGELEQACVAGRTVLDRWDRVRSRRGAHLLREVLTDLRRSGRDRGVREFVAHAERRLRLIDGAGPEVPPP